MAYPTLAELVDASSVDALINSSDEDAAVLRRSAINEIELYTNQKFELEAAATKLLDGTGGRNLVLPKRLAALTTLTVSGSALTAADVVLNADYSILTVPPLAGINGYYEQAMRELEGHPSFAFTFGSHTVTVTGDWGWATPPQDVIDAIRLDMEDQALADANSLSDTVRSYRGLGMLDVAQGNLRATVTGAPSLSARVIRLIAPYIWEGPVGALV